MNRWESIQAEIESGKRVVTPAHELTDPNFKPTPSLQGQRNVRPAIQATQVSDESQTRASNKKLKELEKERDAKVKVLQAIRASLDRRIAKVGKADEVERYEKQIYQINSIMRDVYTLHMISTGELRGEIPNQENQTNE